MTEWVRDKNCEWCHGEGSYWEQGPNSYTTCTQCWIPKPESLQKVAADAVFSPLTKAQNSHLEDILKQTKERITKKYTEGAKEHKGNLIDMPLTQLLEEAIQECTDLTTYLHTALEKLKRLL